MKKLLVLSSRDGGSHRGDPEVKQSHVERNDGLPRSLARNDAE